MKQQSVVIVYLSLSLLVVQFFLMREAKRTAYLEGKQAVYDSLAARDTDGTCYAKNGDCRDNPNGK